MASKSASKGALTVRAHIGDAKTLLAFNLSKAATEKLAGFTIEVKPNGKPSYFLFNMLQFKKPADHSQNTQLPPNSTFNAPLHKFRWVHVPGSANQGVKPFLGKYTYTVTPRYFDDERSMLPIDTALSVSVSVDVKPFEKKGLTLGFTRGFVQSQAFVRHFGPKPSISPKVKKLLFDTSKKAGVDPDGKSYTFEDEYEWLGFTARDRIFEMLDEVVKDKKLRLDVLAYDLNEPDVAKKLLAIAKQRRLRILLDNASLHKSTATKKSEEDEFEKLVPKPKKKSDPPMILRKHFKRYAHDKIFIVSRGKKALRVLTGATNLSVTGLYVNSNHVLVYENDKVAAKYAEMFDTVWQQQASTAEFLKTQLSKTSFPFSGVPSTEVTFAPHDETNAKKILNAIIARIKKEEKQPKSQGCVLFAVMAIAKGTGPVYPALRKLHSNQKIFSYGISDSPAGIVLYKPKTKRGILVTGKPGKTQLPKPFNQVPTVGLGHQIHHKFLVCGFNGSDPTVYCGSSNLALGGEMENGDNLLTIRDEDVATAFAIEAVALVDHFHFLNTAATKSGKKASAAAKASKTATAFDAGWFLGTTDAWVRPYYDAKDIRHADRLLFA